MISLMAFVVIGILVVGLVKDLMKGELGERQERPTLLPQTRPKGKFIIERDRIGSVVITRPGEPGRSVYLQFEADRELIYDILRKSEREDLDRGWTVAVKDSEPRASTLQELWEIHAERLMPQTIKGEKLGGLESLPRTSNPLPFEPEEYLEWTAKFEAGYGQFRPGVSPEQVEKEIAAIPEAIRRTYIAEKYIGREKLFPRATELLPAVRKGLQVMPRLPEETRGDYLFVEYVRDLVRFGEKISDEEARRLWESWKKIPRSTLPEPYQTRVAKPAKPAIVPTAPRRARKKAELEYFADSPEFLSQTIDAIGYRDRIDSTFQEAIKRAKGLK